MLPYNWSKAEVIEKHILCSQFEDKLFSYQEIITCTLKHSMALAHIVSSLAVTIYSWVANQ